jgi:probable addiction module antidote protein
MPKRTASYREGLLKSLTDRREAAYYLEAALTESNELFLQALRDVAESRQMSKVAKEAGVAREALYRMLSETGNPTLSSLTAILSSVGLRLLVAPLEGDALDDLYVASPSKNSIVSTEATRVVTDGQIYRSSVGQTAPTCIQFPYGQTNGFLEFTGTAAGNNAYGGEMRLGTLQAICTPATAPQGLEVPKFATQISRPVFVGSPQ